MIATITRRNQRQEVIYRDAQDGLIMVVAPDGFGRWFYDDVDEAQDDCGPDLKVVDVRIVDDF